jgi:hypothetical protein
VPLAVVTKCSDSTNVADQELNLENLRVLDHDSVAGHDAQGALRNDDVPINGRGPSSAGQS